MTVNRYVLFAVAVLVCLVLSGRGGPGGIVPGERIHSERYENAEQYVAGGCSYRAADVDAVEVSWQSGQVVLEEGDQDLLSAAESGRELPEEVQMHHFLDGRTLRIQFCASGAGGRVDSREKHLTLKLPRRISLTVHTAAADLRGDTLHPAALTADTRSGAIRLTAVQADRVDLSSVSGGQRLERLTADGLCMTSVSGGIQVEELQVDGGVTMSTTSGSVHCDRMEARTAGICTVSGEVELAALLCPAADISTVSGNVEVALPEDTGAAVEFHSVSGRLETELPGEYRGEQWISGDGTNALTVHTVSGNLEMEGI